MQQLIRTRFYAQIKYNKKYVKIPQYKQRFKNTLTQLFENPKKLILVSKTFRIFPSFFNKEILDRMLNNEQDMQYYANYCQKSNRKKNNQIDPQLKIALKNLQLQRSMDQKILECYLNFLRRTQDLTESDTLMEIFDLRNPQNWFGLTYKYQREFIYHHGPTNSGKTYSAMNELKNLNVDQKGIYMAPLRLLAWQAQQKLGKCNLITGQQKDYQNSHLTACTIEACKMDEQYEVAVIDEIQMIEDLERGWAWTNKILGLRAKKIQLCGDQRALSLISKLIDKSGGSLSQKSYNRLSKLHLIKRNFRLNHILPGDCIIDFSSHKLYMHRNRINESLNSRTKKEEDKDQKSQKNKTAIIYGKMPPSSRKYQAQSFNKGELPYLVASNAIGMGLNLMIRRVIFTNLLKMSSMGYQRILQDHQIRQIAGRAGRGMDHGYVICSNSQIREKVKSALKNVNISIQQKDPQQRSIQSNGQSQKMEEGTKNELNEAVPIINRQYDQKLQRYLTQDETKIERAALFFPYPIVQRLKLKIEGLIGKQLKLSDTIKLLCNLSQEDKKLYFIQNTNRIIKLSECLQKLKLPLYYQFLFAGMPISNNLSGNVFNSIIKYAQQFKQRGYVEIPQQIQQQLHKDFSDYTSISDVRKLQKQYVQLEAYTWLWNHLQLYFPQAELAEQLKQRVCKKIDELLAKNDIKIKGKNHNKKMKEEDKS